MQYRSALPIPPPALGDGWISIVKDERGEEWPTGALHDDPLEAMRYSAETAVEWNNRPEPKRRPWWAFWRRWRS